MNGSHLGFNKLLMSGKQLRFSKILLKYQNKPMQFNYFSYSLILAPEEKKLKAIYVGNPGPCLNERI